MDETQLTWNGPYLVPLWIGLQKLLGKADGQGLKPWGYRVMAAKLPFWEIGFDRFGSLHRIIRIRSLQGEASTFDAWRICRPHAFSRCTGFVPCTFGPMDF